MSKRSWTVFSHWWPPSLRRAERGHSRLREPVFPGERCRCHSPAARVRMRPQTFWGRTKKSPKPEAKASPLRWKHRMRLLTPAVRLRRDSTASPRGAASVSPTLCVTQGHQLRRAIGAKISTFSWCICKTETTRTPRIIHSVLRHPKRITHC